VEIDLINGLSIILIAISISLVLSILYYTLKTGISPMPCSARARRCVLDHLTRLSEQAPAQSLAITEAGSGWGHLVIPVALRFPQHKITGYELSWLPFIICRFLKLILQLDNLTLRRQDFLTADLSSSDIITCFLYTKGMSKLRQSLEQQNCFPRWLISVCFALPGYQPEHTQRLNDLYNTPVYFYKNRAILITEE